MLIQSKVLKIKNELQKLKIMAIAINKFQILTRDFTNSSSFIAGDSMFSSQMYLSNNDTEVENVALQNGFPIYNLTNCKGALMLHYNITDTGT
jgi:hypothetical protein